MCFFMASLTLNPKQKDNLQHWCAHSWKVAVVTKRIGTLNKSILLVVSLLMTGLLHVSLREFFSGVCRDVKKDHWNGYLFGGSYI